MMQCHVISEVGGMRPTGKSFCFVSCVSCVRGRGLVVRWKSGENQGLSLSLFPHQVFPFPLQDMGVGHKKR